MAALGRALVRLHEWQPADDPDRAGAPAADDRRAGARRRWPEACRGSILENPSGKRISALPLDDDTRLMLRATTRNTAVPTIVHGGHRINVIPSEIVLDVDGRILPGQDPDEWLRDRQGVVGDDVETELLSREAGIEADPASPLFDAIAATMDAIVPGAEVAPLPGLRRHRRPPPAGRQGLRLLPVQCAGAQPRYNTLVHGHDERIAVDDLAFGTRFLYELVTRFCGR